MSLNAAIRGDLARVLGGARRELEKVTREVTGADTEPVIAAAKVLQREWRDTLRKKGKPAAGQPPRRRKGILAKSIKTAVVEGTRRVGSNDFRARLFEYGYNAKDGTPQPPRPHARVALEASKEQMTETFVGEAQRKIGKGRR